MQTFDEEFEKIEKELIKKLNKLNCSFEDRKLQSLLYHYNRIIDYSKKNEDIAILNRVNVLLKDLPRSYVPQDIIEKLKNMLD